MFVRRSSKAQTTHYVGYVDNVVSVVCRLLLNVYDHATVTMHECDCDSISLCSPIPPSPHYILGTIDYNRIWFYNNEQHIGLLLL